VLSLPRALETAAAGCLEAEPALLVGFQVQRVTMLITRSSVQLVAKSARALILQISSRRGTVVGRCRYCGQGNGLEVGNERSIA
jgi:hypothetical protein